MFTLDYVKQLLSIQNNERKLKAYRTKKENEMREISLREDITKYFKEGGNCLLDKLPPKEGNKSIPPMLRHYEEQLQIMAEQKGASAITFTFKEPIRLKFDEMELRQYLIRIIRTICLNKDIKTELILIPDCDENGNFHYHGCIKQPVKFRPSFKKNITEYVGFMKFDYIKDTTGWINYCLKKDKEIYTEDDINNYGIYLNI